MSLSETELEILMQNGAVEIEPEAENSDPIYPPLFKQKARLTIAEPVNIFSLLMLVQCCALLDQLIGCCQLSHDKNRDGAFHPLEMFAATCATILSGLPNIARLTISQQQSSAAVTAGLRLPKAPNGPAQSAANMRPRVAKVMALPALKLPDLSGDILVKRLQEKAKRLPRRRHRHKRPTFLNTWMSDLTNRPAGLVPS